MKYVRNGGLVLLLALSMYSKAQPLTDPTRPSLYGGDSSQIAALRENYHLSSVIHSENRRFAVINGKGLREGDRIDDALVTRIDRSGVRLVVRDLAFTLHLATQDIKRP